MQDLSQGKQKEILYNTEGSLEIHPTFQLGLETLLYIHDMFYCHMKQACRVNKNLGK